MAAQARIDIAALQQAEQAEARAEAAERTGSGPNDTANETGGENSLVPGNSDEAEVREDVVNVQELLANAGIGNQPEPGQLISQLV